jgi:uncharacterized SAM-binding protein YcdF (DUF218 family)
VQPLANSLTEDKDVKRRRKLSGCFFLIAAGTALLLIGHGTLLRAVGNFLVVRDTIVPSDAIFLLTGDVHTRPVKAAELYRAGIAPRVLFANQLTTPAVAAGVALSEPEGARRMLVRYGVPDSAILILPARATSTWDEALALRAYARNAPIHRVIIVTSSSHGRRARWLFRKALRGRAVDIHFATVDDYRFDMDEWWIREEGLVTVINEYLRFLHNAFTRH